MIVKPSQVEAAIAFMDGDHAAEIHYRASMARIEREEAEAEAFAGFNDGSVEERKRRARLAPRVMELARAEALAEAEVRRLRTKMEKAAAIIELFRTESANAREGVL